MSEPFSSVDAPPVVEAATEIAPARGSKRHALRFWAGLVWMELFKLRRRRLTRVLFGIQMVLLVLVLGTLAVLYSSIQARPLSYFGLQATPCVQSSPASGTPTTSGGSTPCPTAAPTDAERQTVRAATLASFRQFFVPPLSITLIIEFNRAVGLFLVAILAGAVVGGEYSLGTIRLLLSRGPGPIQLLTAKIAALALTLFVGIVLTTIVGTGIGVGLAFLTGASVQWSFLGGDFFVRLFWLWGVTTLALMVYALVALFAATLTRSSAGGIAGAILYAVSERAASNLLPFFASRLTSPPISAFFLQVQTYLMDANVTALIQRAETGPLANGALPATLPDSGHALLTLGTYGLLCFGLSALLVFRRDVAS
jgi:ABC-type transport system involved in multi-copper enzyme maturation permease subunit